MVGSEAPDQYGVAGHPIAHSWSPFIHGMFAKATAQNLVYRLFDITPENFNDENKSKRQMNAFFDVDAAANSHDGRSLKAERSGKKLSKQELKQFKEKRKAKKEEKRKAWLRD